jgi:hypothetical protein
MTDLTILQFLSRSLFRRAMQRTDGPCGARLCLTNAILSSVFGLEFPIGEAQWPRIREARDALKDMLREQQAGSDLPA